MRMKWGREMVGDRLELELGSGRIQCHSEAFGMWYLGNIEGPGALSLGRQGLPKERIVCGKCLWLCVQDLELWEGDIATTQRLMLSLGWGLGRLECVLSHFSRVWLFETPRTAARQAPPSMGFSRQEYWSGLPFPPLGWGGREDARHHGYGIGQNS